MDGKKKVKIHHQATKCTTAHQVCFLTFLVNLCELGALVVKPFHAP